ALEREDLVGIEQPLRIEHALDPHLKGKLAGCELARHEIAFLDADTMLACEAAPDLDAELKDIRAGFLRATKLLGVVGLEKNERMEIAVAGMENICDLEAV